VIARVLGWLTAGLSACFWLQRDYPLALDLAPPRPRGRSAHRKPDRAAIIRKRILSAYWDADAAARDALAAAGWPLYS
jgi:hypothetical protein